MTSKICVLGSYVCQMSVCLPHVPKPGETITASTFDMGPGGKGSNVAIGIKRMGGDVALIEKVGNDVFGEMAIATYQKENIDTKHVVAGDVQSGIGLVYIQPGGENTAAYYPGANNALSARDILNAEDIMDDAEILYLQLEIPDEPILAAVRLAKEKGIKVVLNPAPARKIPPELLGMVDVITPNQGEAMTLTGTPFKEALIMDEIEALGKKLLELGPEEVYLTLGGKGAFYMNQSAERYYQQPFKVDVVDTVGAGDTFNAALCVAMQNKLSTADSLLLACIAGALTTTRLGVIEALPTKDEIDHFIHNNNLKKVF